MHEATILTSWPCALLICNRWWLQIHYNRYLATDKMVFSCWEIKQRKYSELTCQMNMKIAAKRRILIMVYESNHRRWKKKRKYKSICIQLFHTLSFRLGTSVLKLLPFPYYTQHVISHLVCSWLKHARHIAPRLVMSGWGLSCQTEVVTSHPVCHVTPSLPCQIKAAMTH